MPPSRTKSGSEHPANNPNNAPGERRPPRLRKRAQGGKGTPTKRQSHDPTRLAVLQAYLAFERDEVFQTTPPGSIKDDAQRRLYTHMLKGMVRHRRFLEAEVLRLAKAKPEKLEPLLVALAMLGLYQLRFLEVSDHAAVFETVALTAPLSRDWCRGWVNAILRTAQREGGSGTETAHALSLGVRTSHPDWLVRRWTTHYGDTQGAAICAANNQYDGAALRVETRRIQPAALLELLREAGASVEHHPLLPGALWADPLGAVLNTQAFRDGYCYVQDVSSQLLTAWCAPLLRGRVLDACAAPGGKLTYLVGLGGAGQSGAGLGGAEQGGAGLGGEGSAGESWVVGADHSAARIVQIRQNFQRLRLPKTPLLQADGARLPFVNGAFDAVLLDAPCSATGMIRKYPELKWRKHERDLPRLARIQQSLLTEAARVLRPGGVIVYATCSLEPEENEATVNRFLENQPQFQQRRFTELAPPEGLGCLPETLLTPEGNLLLLPRERQMGVFGAVMERTT